MARTAFGTDGASLTSELSGLWHREITSSGALCPRWCCWCPGSVGRLQREQQECALRLRQLGQRAPDKPEFPPDLDHPHGRPVCSGTAGVTQLEMGFSVPALQMADPHRRRSESEPYEEKDNAALQFGSALLHVTWFRIYSSWQPFKVPLFLRRH